MKEEENITKSVLKSNRELPQTPDLSYQPPQPVNRQEPFALANFSGSNANQTNKP